MKNFRKGFAYAFILCLSLMQVGCGGSSGVAASDVDSVSYYNSGFTNGISYESSYDMAPQMTSMKSESYNGSGSISVKQTFEQKLIRTVSINIELETSDLLSVSVTDIGNMAKSYDGYSTYSSIDMDTRYASGNMTIKVPKENVDKFLGEVKEKGYTIKSTTDNYEDVTMEYTDVESRLSVKLKARERYENILENAETVENIISVQTKIDSITEEIESAQARLNVMNNRIDYTEINIHLSCKTSVDRESFWERAKNRLGDIFYNAGDTFIGGIEWFVNVAIVLLFFIPIAIVLIKIFLIAIGKKKFSLKGIIKHKKDSIQMHESKDEEES